ncbi:hypothetical protein VI03_24700 [Burkholderia vietnamiensis]|nr:hypothetical protein VI03_24700 [Burkholderia vietnamiensis]
MRYVSHPFEPDCTCEGCLSILSANLPSDGIGGRLGSLLSTVKEISNELVSEKVEDAFRYNKRIYMANKLGQDQNFLSGRVRAANKPQTPPILWRRLEFANDAVELVWVQRYLRRDLSISQAQQLLAHHHGPVTAEIAHALRLCLQGLSKGWRYDDGVDSRWTLNLPLQVESSN